MINLSHPAILDLFPQHRAPRRSDSAAFLIWYLENYYRLETVEAIDAVCDQPGDKGVDGIFVNDNNQTITIFQSRIYQGAAMGVGDKSLREFAGTITQFDTAEKIAALIEAAGAAQVARLARRLDLVNKIATHELRGEFVTNLDMDGNGEAFIDATPLMMFVGKTVLETTYISDSRDIPPHARRSFDTTGFDVTEYTVDANTRAVIAPVKASELVTLEGVADQSVFAYNVRGPLGKTGVNKEIAKSIDDAASHKLFPLFHNGITIISRDVDIKNGAVEVSDYFVVNGCQSLTALYENRSKLTSDLRMLVKFIKMEPDSALANTITQYSNNQNGVKQRDFKANHPIQIRLQNEFNAHYAGQYVFEIKRGEVLGPGEKLTNEDAGLYLRAFDLKEPWTTHRRGEVLDDKHADLFGRPAVTADRIVLCQAIVDEIDAALPRLENQLVAKYVLVRYLLLYIVREIMERDDIGKAAISDPATFVRDPATKAKFQTCIRTVINDIIIDFNFALADVGEDFDYRDRLRDQKWDTDIRGALVGDYLKQVARGRIASISDEWGANG